MFNFGSAAAIGQSSSTPAFSFSTAPTNAFGATGSTAAFGAPPSSGSLFGSTATTTAAANPGTSNMFGTSPAPGGLFGAIPAASSASFFGSSLAPTLSGAATSGAFGATTSSLFGTAKSGAASSQPFESFSGTLGGAVGGLFNNTSTSATGLFAPSVPQQQAATTLTAKEGKPLAYITKWEDISENGQEALLQLEKMITQQREDCRMLSENQRLWGSEGKQLKEEVAQDEAMLRQAMAGLNAVLQGDIKTLSVFREKALALLHDTEVAVRTFQRSHRWRTAGKVLPGQALPPGIREQLNGPVVLPSAFLQRVVINFQETVQQYSMMITEVEALLPGEESSQHRQPTLPVDVLPTVLRNLHDFFCHVAARLEKLHDNVAAQREAYLLRRQKAGDNSDPFKEADRIERLRKEAQAKKTTVIPSATQPQVQPQAQPVASQPLLQLTAPAAPTGGLFGSTPTAALTPSLFGAPAAATAATPSLFGGTATVSPPATGTGFGFGFGTAGNSLFSNPQSTPAASTGASGTRRGRSRK